MKHLIQGMQLRHHPLIGLAMASGCLIGAAMLCIGVSGCDSEEKGSESSQPNPGSKKAKSLSVGKGPQDALLLAQRAHGFFIEVVGPKAVVWYQGTATSNYKAFPYTKSNSFWVWTADSVSVGRSMYFQLIPAWSKNKLLPGKDVVLERIGPFRWRTHRIAVFGDPNDAFFAKVQKELLRRTQKVEGASSRQDERHQSEEGTDTLLLAQRISHQFAMAIPDGIAFSFLEEDVLQVSLRNYGFQVGSETKHFLPAGDYFPRIAPEGDKPVWLWRAWNPNDGKEFLLIEVLPGGKRVQHAGVMQEIRDYGPCTVHEYTWEGHGIRVYAWEDHEWVDGVMPSFHKYFSTSEEGDEVAPE